MCVLCLRRDMKYVGGMSSEDHAQLKRQNRATQARGYEQGLGFELVAFAMQAA